MTMEKNHLKLIFGIIIFMFSLALAYFAANYLDPRGGTYTTTQPTLDYWAALAIFAGVYIVVGIVVYSVLPVSMGFLFSADVLILHLLFENFGDIPSIMKTAIIGVILVVLYAIAWEYMKDDPGSSPLPPAPSMMPPANPNEVVPPTFN